MNTQKDYAFKSIDYTFDFFFAKGGTGYGRRDPEGGGKPGRVPVAQSECVSMPIRGWQQREFQRLKLEMKIHCPSRIFGEF
ncbi:unnamed protein product [Caenorhabditis auriculariae]|uniref:Uncharacterized protein n=1 Tax=Caenorhabditis auriculariae TaxID=2777116 RepID=A0A8S1GU64_9PELO|nr:unnamed protein product [Caenorhabditis auriculariae]